MTDFQSLRTEYLKKLESLKSKKELEWIKTELLGKTGKITSLFKNIGNWKEN